MAEPDPKLDDSRENTGSPQPAPRSTSDLLKLVSSDLFRAGKPTDDTPTVISRFPAPMSPEDAVAGMLRGHQLAHFELLEPIGVGGMAAVIRARDTQLDRTVALKILPPEMAGDSEVVKRFHQEARAAAKLDHENIARVFFCGEEQGLHFIAFEMVEGENLKTLLEQRGRIPVPEAISYMLQIATGLAHASERGVVHRDIKPSNIIISANGRAKLVDMGLARSLDHHKDEGLTQSGMTLGTFDYISPEQALEPRDADVRSDIYSLGCTFYHMLTGQPPVPEGTAAKKLHHHQHIDPPDPRQLNPQIPDDVAALLAHMMAKNPKDRYQRPEHLVQHLIVLAQKLGAVNDVSDAVLFVDAPLPRPPRRRPLLVAGVAALVVVALVVMLGPPSQAPAPSQPGQNINASGKAKPGTTQAAEDSQAKVAPTVTTPLANNSDGSSPADEPKRPPFRAGAKDAAALAEFLRNTPDAVVLLRENVELTSKDQLVFRGRRLLIKPENPEAKTPPTIRLEYDSTPTVSWAILRILGGSVVIDGIRFELISKEAKIDMSAIDWQGGHLLAKNCQFMQPGSAGPEQGRISSVRLSGESAKDDMPDVELLSCFFAGGQNAISASGPGLVHASQCAFGPHTKTLVNLEKPVGQNPDPHRSVSLTNCSAFLVGNSAAFRMDDGIEFLVHADNCVFSRPEGEAGSSVLIEQLGNPNINSKYLAMHNCYHNLEAFWIRSAGLENRENVTSLDAFKQRFPKMVQDENSTELAESPWPVAQPLKLLEENEPKKAFALREDLRELRQTQNDRHPIGVERFWGEARDHLMPALDRKQPETVARSPERIVDPSLTEARPNIYKKLGQAIDDAQPGDLILIKHNGLLREEPVPIKDANARLTIRPFPGTHPVLTIGQSTEPDAALIRLHDGKVTLENLEFLLAPDKAGYKAQSVVMVVGDGQCTFNKCVATLEGARDGTSLSLVTLSDPSAVMKIMPQPAQQQDPGVALSGCFVRGTGQVLGVRVSRPFDLKVEDSLVVLAGSLVVMDANSKDTTVKGKASLAFSHLTTYLTDHLVLLRALKEGGMIAKGLVLTEVRSASDCLFASGSGNTKSLIHLENMDSEDMMKRYFLWDESQHNAYSNYTQYLEQQPADGSSMAQAYGLPQWKDFAKDSDGRFERVKFTAAPISDVAMARAVGANFKMIRSDANLQGIGVNVESLPKLSEDSGTARTPEGSSNN